MSGTTAVADLREVLGAAAVTAGLALADPNEPTSLTDAQARQAARAWGLLGPRDEPDVQPGGTGRGGVVVILVDGLGAYQLAQRRGHTPTLRGWQPLAGGSAATCWPSTTAAALTTLGTGTPPGVTGMLGYSVRRPEVARPANASSWRVSAHDNLCLISWDGAATSPRQWQNVPTLFERLTLAPGRTRSIRGQLVPYAVTVGPARFAGSGLTEAGLRGARHLAADRLEDRPARAAVALRQGVALVYLYVGELDHAGHRHGWCSQQWLAELERLDAMLAELERRVPRGTRLLLTADHGMIDTDDDHRVVLTDHHSLVRDVAGVAGEPRLTHLYTWGADERERTERSVQVAERWRQALGERAAWVATAQELCGQSRPVQEEVPTLPFGPVSVRGRSVLGDVVVAMADHWVVVDPRVHSPEAIAMPGVHGSVTPEETRVPLLTTWT